MSEKPSNPKDAVGIKKAPLSTVSAPVIAEIGLGMLEGARKYGRHNYRVIGVRSSVYYDATMRHLMAWWEGEDVDPDSGLSHVTKALASLVVLRDAMINAKLEDDRPPRPPAGWLAELNARAAALLEKYPNPVPAYLHEGSEEHARDVKARGEEIAEAIFAAGEALPNVPLCPAGREGCMGLPRPRGLEVVTCNDCGRSN